MSLIARFSLLTALLLSLIALSPSAALTSGWSAIASTCALDDNAMLTFRGKPYIKYDHRGGILEFQPRALSAKNVLGLALPITARCQVLSPLEVRNPAWGSVIVTYQDPDGPGTDARIVVKLVRNFRPSGFQTIAVFDSNLYAPTGAGFVDQAVTFDPAHINFADSDYVVGINLYRSTLASKPRVLRVRLDE